MSDQNSIVLVKVIKYSIERFILSTGVLSYKFLDSPEVHKESMEVHFASVIGFSGGSFKGSLVAICEAAFLDKSHPNHQMDMPVGPDEIADWSGEISNQLLGRIKNILCANDVKFDMGTPTTVSGKTMQIAAPKEGILLKLRFAGEHGPIDVFFQVVMDKSLIIQNIDLEKPPEASAGTSENWSLVF